MGFEFERGDASAASGFRRIAVELFDKALAAAADGQKAIGQGSAADVEKAIHEARKCCKKLRAQFRLARGSLPEWRAENAAVRDAARLLAGTRDAQVLAATFDEVARQADAGDNDALGVLRERAIAAHGSGGNPDGQAAALAAFAETMVSARGRALNFRLGTKGFGALSGGLGSTYRSARKRMASLDEGADAESFHEWRKRVKDHWYHARILTPVFPRLMEAHAGACGELGDMLGRHHDLCVLHAVLGRVETGGENDALRDRLVETAAGAARTLEKQSRVLGARLFADKPDALVGRWKAWWKLRPRKRS